MGERVPAGTDLAHVSAVPEDALLGLVVRARDGDREAFASLYRARIGDVSRYVGAILRDRDRAEDVVAQTFLLAWRDMPKLRRPERFDAWLFRIAHNQAMSDLRRRPAIPLEEAPEAADPAPLSSPAAAAEAAADARHVRGALLRLPEAQREVLILRFLRGLSHAETATRMGKTQQATRALQLRALSWMRTFMESSAAR